MKSINNKSQLRVSKAGKFQLLEYGMRCRKPTLILSSSNVLPVRPKLCLISGVTETTRTCTGTVQGSFEIMKVCMGTRDSDRVINLNRRLLNVQLKSAVVHLARSYSLNQDYEKK